MIAPIRRAKHLRAPTLGDYRLGRPLGEGASARVFMAQHLPSGNWVALKVFEPVDPHAMDERAEIRQRFLREAEVIKRLQHPDIVVLHEAGESAGSLWLAMELAPGCSLQRYTDRQRLLPAPAVLGICARLARAMAHAHGLGIVHRDIKPSNVLVDLASDSVKLTDFGTAHLPDSRRTGTEMILGTPVYMAPEMLAGNTASAAGDLYSLGALLFELLTGALPHHSASLGELLRLVAAQPAPDLRHVWPACPPALAELVSGLLSKQPAGRPTDGNEVAEQISRIQASWPAPTRGA